MYGDILVATFKQLVPDTTPPSVAWTSPALNALVSGTVTLTASSTDNVAVGSVAFYLGSISTSTLIGSSSTPSGTLYSVPWDTTTAANGSTTLWALSTDTSNNTSTASTTVIVNNPPSVPSAPQSLASTPGNTSVSLSWLAPSSNGGASLTQYLVYDRLTGSSTFALYATTTPSQTTSTVTGLTNGQSYDLEVLAQNSVGTSTASNIASSTPYTVPGAPTGVTATSTVSQQASVSFVAPASNGGSAITLYTITSNPGNLTATTTVATTTVVSGLTNGTSYTFTVFATNAAGNSATSSPSNSVTPTGPYITWTLMPQTSVWPTHSQYMSIRYDPVSTQTYVFAGGAGASSIYSSEHYFYNAAR
jgi:hypothetical protein